MAGYFLCCPKIETSPLFHELIILELIIYKVCRCVVTHLASKMFEFFTFSLIFKSLTQMASNIVAAGGGGGGAEVLLWLLQRKPPVS